MSSVISRSRKHHVRHAASIPGIPKSQLDQLFQHTDDYSESFMEEDCFSPGSDHDIVPPLTMDQTILEGMATPPQRDAQTPFGTREGSAFSPSELPTKHSRRLSEKSKHSKHSFNGVIPKRVSSLAAPMMGKSSPAQVRNPKHLKSQWLTAI